MIEGAAIVRAVEKVGSESGKTKKVVRIVDCGELGGEREEPAQESGKKRARADGETPKKKTKATREDSD